MIVGQEVIVRINSRIFCWWGTDTGSFSTDMYGCLIQFLQCLFLLNRLRTTVWQNTTNAIKINWENPKHEALVVYMSNVTCDALWQGEVQLHHTVRAVNSPPAGTITCEAKYNNLNTHTSRRR
jgi:hypothetical protein